MLYVFTNKKTKKMRVYNSLQGAINEMLPCATSLDEFIQVTSKNFTIEYVNMHGIAWQY